MLFKENREKKNQIERSMRIKKTADRTFLLGIQWKSLHIEVIKNLWAFKQHTICERRSTEEKKEIE